MKVPAEKTEAEVTFAEGSEFGLGRLVAEAAEGPHGEAEQALSPGVERVRGWDGRCTDSVGSRRWP